ncbi:MAG TPA: aldo/keto reductase [bacterium]|nr:aldo/keto reductase [bacterium]HPR88006.1 aldo/keto reductase [bacterium]
MASDKMARRQFLRSGSLGLLLAGLGMPAAKGLAAEKEKIKKIPRRVLGRTRLKIPILSFGVMNSDSPDLINRALDSGITHLDTANGYLRGNSEKSIGNVLKQRGGRDKVILSTKIWLARDFQKGVFSTEDGSWAPGATPENFSKLLNASLERLQSDYVDILYIHACDNAQMVNYEPLMNAARAAQQAGKARFIGVSCHAAVAEVVRAAVDAKIYDVAEIAFNVWREDKEQIREALAYAKEHGLGIVAMKTQGGNPREGATAVNHPAALKWVLRHPEVTTAIPGMTSFDQLDLNLASAANLDLSDEEENYLKLGAIEKGRLCQGCRACVVQCPHGVEIPSLMRASMYATGYGNLSQAEWTLATLPERQGLGACRSCSSCTAVCAHALDISREVAALKSHFPFLG